MQGVEMRLFFRMALYSVAAFLVIYGFSMPCFAAEGSEPASSSELVSIVPVIDSPTSRGWVEESSSSNEGEQPEESSSVEEETASSEETSVPETSSSEGETPEESSSVAETPETNSADGRIPGSTLDMNDPNITVDEAVFQIRYCLIFFVFGVIPLLCAAVIVYLLYKWVYRLLVHSV